MNTWKNIGKQLKTGIQSSLLRYPAVIANAFLITLLTMILIYLDWEEQKSVQFLFICLQLAASVAAFAGLTLSAWAGVYDRKWLHKKSVNLISGLCTIAVFLLLYFFSGKPSYDASYTVVSNLAVTSVGICIAISLLLFVYAAGRTKETNPIADSFFMVQKSAIIAAFYGLVLMAGTSLVALAVQSLLYRGMSEKVYMYLSVISVFTAFLLFVGFFPEFGTDRDLDKRRQMEKQPRFIEILFGSILVPIVLALTVVLLLWAARMVVLRSGQEFSLLSGIAASYTLLGIWLHLMITNLKGKLPAIYRKVYPIAAGLILLVELWALTIQTTEYGIRPEEYFFGIGWIFAVVSVILLVLKKEKAHGVIILLGSVLLLISILPWISYQEVSARSQMNRLEKVLEEAGILENESIVQTESEPEDTQKETITETVSYLDGIWGESRTTAYPQWFTKNLSDPVKFEEVFGFEQKYRESSYNYAGNYGYTILEKADPVTDIRDWEWSVDLNEVYAEDMDGSKEKTVDGVQGTYEISWWIPDKETLPELKIMRDGELLYSDDLSSFMEELMSQYTEYNTGNYQLPADELMVHKEFDGGEFLLVIERIEISFDDTMKSPYIYIIPDALYLKENK